MLCCLERQDPCTHRTTSSCATKLAIVLTPLMHPIEAALLYRSLRPSEALSEFVHHDFNTNVIGKGLAIYSTYIDKALSSCHPPSMCSSLQASSLWNEHTHLFAVQIHFAVRLALLVDVLHRNRRLHGNLTLHHIVADSSSGSPPAYNLLDLSCSRLLYGACPFCPPSVCASVCTSMWASVVHT
jgi:hypothetical protein